MEEHFDVVIIGSGLGGLLSGVILSREGMKVCILEKDKQAGGCLQTFSQEKTVFDSCVHYIGGLGDGHTLNQIFGYAGIVDKLRLWPFDQDGFDRICFGDEDILYPQAVGRENFIDQLVAYFPKEKASLAVYLDRLRLVGDRFPLYRLRAGQADEKSLVSSWSMDKTMSEISANPKLRQVLAGNNLLYAGERDASPFYLHALVLESYIHSAHKVLPGSSEIAKYLVRVLRAQGGELYRNTQVTGIVEEQGLVRYVETNKGSRIYAKQFIANLHPSLVLDMLRTSMIRPAFRNRINSLRQTTSAFMLNLVLRPQTVAMRPYNLYWHATDDVWEAVRYRPQDWPANYALYFTESCENPGFAESLSILSYMHFDEVKPWADTLNHSGEPGDRGSGYEAFKAARSERLLACVLTRVPELRGHIIAASAATPLTYRDYTGTPGGALYGILKDVHRPAETTVSTRTRIPNLYLTGQNVNLHGVLGVSITAVATCGELLGLNYLLEKIRS